MNVVWVGENKSLSQRPYHRPHDLPQQRRMVVGNAVTACYRASAPAPAVPTGCWGIRKRLKSGSGLPRRGTKSGALLQHSVKAHDEGLAEVIDACPELPAALKSGILAIVRVVR